jgi:hypothetical protein
MEEGTIGAGLDLVNDIGFEVNVKGAGNVFASSSFCLHNHNTLEIFWGAWRRTCGGGERGTRQVGSSTHQKRRLRNQYRYGKGIRERDGRRAKRWHDMSFTIAGERRAKNLRSNRAQAYRVPLRLISNFRDDRRVEDELKLTASITNLDTWKAR